MGLNSQTLHFFNGERVALACSHEAQLQPLPEKNVTIFTSANAALACTQPMSSGCCWAACAGANESFRAKTDETVSKHTPQPCTPADGVELPHVEHGDGDALAHAFEHVICCQWREACVSARGGAAVDDSLHAAAMPCI
jgi:hypothetical protein